MGYEGIGILNLGIIIATITVAKYSKSLLNITYNFNKKTTITDEDINNLEIYIKGKNCND